MANQKPPEGRRFQKGVSGNPLGAGAHNKEVKMIRKMTKEQVAEILTHILNGNMEAIRNISMDADSSALKVLVCKAILKDSQKGSIVSLQALLDRTIGKVKDEVEIKLPRPTIIEHLNGDKTILGSELPEDE